MNTMKKTYDIAVIGESMSGKSTWIASLFERSINLRLKGMAEVNEKGQTKIPIYYRLMSPQYGKIMITEIKWNIEKILRDEELETLVRILEKLGIKPDNENSKSGEGLEKYFTSIRYDDIDVIEFIGKVANNSDLGGKNLISYIEVSGSADENIWGIMNKNNLKNIRLRDTRGFLDESKEKMQEYFKDIEKIKKEEGLEDNSLDKQKVYTQKLLDERGIYSVDACVFMSIANANALLKEKERDIYGPLIKNILEKYPTFLTVRTDKLTEILEKAIEEDKKLEYEQIVKDIPGHLGKRFSGFDSLEKLLEDLGLNKSNSDYRKSIANRHFKKLLMPEIKILQDEDPEIMLEKIYKKSSAGIFSEVILGIKEFSEHIESAEAFLEKINDKNRVIEDIKKLFDNNFVKAEEYYIKSDKYKEYVNKIKGDYYGGGTSSFVGPKGGLTTHITGYGRVGKYAISILEESYFMREKLYESLIDSLEPDIKNFVEQSYTEPTDISEKIVELKSDILLKYKKQSDSSFEMLSKTGRMIERRYLKSAHKITKQNLEITQDYIGKYLKEFENSYDTQEWLKDRHIISAVKYLYWKVIEKTLL